MAQQHKRRLEKSEAAYRRLAAQHAATQALIKGRTTSDVLPGVLQAVCEALDWGEAALWWVDREGKCLRCAEFWSAPTSTTSEFETMRSTLSCSSGQREHSTKNSATRLQRLFDLL